MRTSRHKISFQLYRPVCISREENSSAPSTHHRHSSRVPHNATRRGLARGAKKKETSHMQSTDSAADFATRLRPERVLVVERRFPHPRSVQRVGIHRTISNGHQSNVKRTSNIICRRCPCWRRRRWDCAAVYIIQEFVVADDAVALVVTLGAHICIRRRQVYCYWALPGEEP